MKIIKFEDLDCWKEVRVMTQSVYAATRNGPFKQDYGLTDQIKGAATSIMANIDGFLVRVTVSLLNSFSSPKPPLLNYRATYILPLIKLISIRIVSNLYIIN